VLFFRSLRLRSIPAQPERQSFRKKACFFAGKFLFQEFCKIVL